MSVSPAKADIGQLCLPIAISRSLFLARDGDRVRLITRNGRLVALNGPTVPVWRCPLFGEDRKSRFAAVRTAVDPEADIVEASSRDDLGCWRVKYE
jgi:hypothetical protein